MKKLLALSLALLLLFGLCACGSSGKSASYDSAATGSAYDSAPAAYNSAPAEFGDMAAAEESYSLGTSETSEAQSRDASTETGLDSEKIIYTCYAEIETLDFAQSTADVERLIARCGGFLQSSSVRGTDYYADGHRSAEYVIRIPRDQFEEVTSGLSNLGSVSYSTVNAENISANYHDTESRLAAYEIEEERLLSMLELCETVEDMLSIEDRLTDVRYNIESLTSTILGWDSLVNYSTLTIQLTEVVEYTAEEELGYWQRIGSGFMRTLRGVGDFFTGFFRVLLVISPVLVVLAALAAIVLLIVRGAKKRRAKKGLPPCEKTARKNKKTKRAEEPLSEKTED